MSGSVIDLNQGWRVVQDVHDAGEQYGLYRADWDPLRIQYAVSDWQPIDRLAHLQLLFAEQPYFGRELRSFNEHPWWYRLEFPTPEHAADGTTLRFEGVDYYAKVWLNETLLGEHEGYFDPFGFEVGHLLRQDGPNVLVVQVASPWDRETLPDMESRRVFAVVRHLVKGTYEHADTFVQRDVNPIGIWRPVHLVCHRGLRAAAPPHVVARSSDDGARAEVAVAWSVTAAAGERMVEFVARIVDDATGAVAAYTSAPMVLAEGTAELTAQLQLDRPRLWTTWDRGEPALYRAELAVRMGDETLLAANERFGVRSVVLRRDEHETTFVLNGRPIFLRGTCYFPDCYLSVLDRGRYERDVAAMVQAGINAVRVHVHVQHPAFYGVCDRLGVAVLQDSDLNWVHPTDEAFARRAVTLFGAMIRQLRNHPSIVGWICMNEPAGRAQGPMATTSPGPQLYAEARRLDPTRPAIKGSGNEADPDSGDSHNYRGSLRGHDTHYTDIYGTTEKLVTEFGFDAPPPPARARLVPRLAARLAPVLPRVHELHDYQYWLTKYYVEHYRMQKYGPCSGYFQFMWIDLCPQSFYGVYDWWGLPKVEGIGGALRALEESNRPVGIFMEYKDGPVALWAVNDLLQDLGTCRATWLATDGGGDTVAGGAVEVTLGPDSRVRAADLVFPARPGTPYHVALELRAADGRLLARNRYRDPFHHPPHPEGHPHRMEHELGMRLYWAP